jgi:two-component system, NarL family, sensor histidine kinase UhpB
VNPELRALTRRYARALQGFLSGRGEAALQEAYDLGREALARGLGVHDLATIQHRALLKALLAMPTRQEGSHALRAAGKFFVEGMLPFEMSHRRSQEVNAALRESEERYRSVVDTARDVIFTLEADGRIVSLNPVFETITGWSRAEWIGKDFLRLAHPDDRARAAELTFGVLEGRAPAVFELGLLARSGAAIPSEVVATSLLRDDRIAGILGVARDITDRRLAQKALHRLNQALEEEVKRIAHALHDEAGQLLASVHIGLAEVARDLPPHSAQRLNNVRGLLDKIEEQLRHLSHELRPTILDDLGLRPALEFLADGVSRRTGLQIVVEGSPDVRLPTSAETALYRIVQEALTNVAKHAKATRVTIAIERSGHFVRWIIRDDGLGFDVPTVLGRRGSRGLGLIGIQERLQGIGGTLEITSTPRGGTQLLISIPVEADGGDPNSPRG